MSNFDLRIHPAAELFPLLAGVEFDALVEDIRENGCREPVVFTPDNELLDGRNRYRACKKLGDEPPRRIEHSEPWAYVVSVNLHRRHLNESQRAMVGAKIAERHVGQRGPVSADTADSPKPLPPNREQAAKMLNVGTASVSRGRQVLEHGTPGLQQAVDGGHVPVTTAARVAQEMEPEDQDKFVARVLNGEVARKIAPPDSGTMRRTRAAKKRLQFETPPTSATTTGGDPRGRYQYIRDDTIRSVYDVLTGLGSLLTSTDGLHPDIHTDEARKFESELLRVRKHLNSLITALRERASA